MNLCILHENYLIFPCYSPAYRIKYTNAEAVFYNQPDRRSVAMELSLWIIPIFALCALLFAAYKARYVSSASPGNARMQEIAGSIAEGASAFLRS